MEAVSVLWFAAQLPSMISPSRNIRVLVPALLAACFVAAVALPAVGQPPVGLRNASPRQLLQEWKTAERTERPALAAEMIARRGQMLPELRAAVRGGDQAEKLLACSMIAELRDRDSLADVIAATADPDVVVRRRAATVLRILGDRRAAARLRRILREESDLGVMMSSLAALGRIGDAGNRLAVQPFLNHDSAAVRVVAAGALAMLGDERGLEIVLVGSESDDPEVRSSATYALGLFDAAAAGERIEEILADPNGAWKSHAQIAQVERRLRGETAAQRLQTLDELANGRSRTAAEWAVDRLTDIGGPEAVAVLRGVRGRSTPVGAKAGRSLLSLGVEP